MAKIKVFLFTCSAVLLSCRVADWSLELVSVQPLIPGHPVQLL